VILDLLEFKDLLDLLDLLEVKGLLDLLEHKVKVFMIYG
jgi:hypothetical protein